MRLNKFWRGAPVCLLVFSMFACSKSADSITGGCTVNCVTPPPPPTASLSASPSAITMGGSVTLSWSSANATSCTASWTSSTSTNGSASVTPTQTTSYTVSCTGSGGTAQGTTTVVVNVPPSLSGKVVAAVWGTQPAFSNLRIRISSPSGSLKDSTDMKSDGSFASASATTAQILAGDSVCYTVDAISTSNRQYHPRIGCRSTANLANGLNLVLIPFTPIAYNLGIYAGIPVSVDLQKAFIPTTDDTDIETFYPKFDAVVNGVHFEKYPFSFWASFPQPVAFEHNPPPVNTLPPWEITHDMTSSDSASQWQGHNRFNQIYGFTAWRPANQSEVVFLQSGTKFQGVLENVDSLAMGNTGASALSGMSTDANNNITFGLTDYRTVVTANFAGAVEHEDIHLLGPFGNGCGWHGVESTGCGPGWQTAAEPTAEDVVYSMLAYNVHALEVKYGDSYAIAESDQGERVLMLNLPAQKILKQ